MIKEECENICFKKKVSLYVCLCDIPYFYFFIRYGLPVNFQAMLLQPNKKTMKKLREVLYELYKHLDSSAAAIIDVSIYQIASQSRNWNEFQKELLEKDKQKRDREYHDTQSFFFFILRFSVSLLDGLPCLPCFMLVRAVLCFTGFLKASHYLAIDQMFAVVEIQNQPVILVVYKNYKLQRKKISNYFNFIWQK